MNNDLISRSALKEELSRALLCEEPDKRYRQIIDIIDNAPTVEAYPFEQVQELVKLNQQFAEEIEELKKPQGEWIFIEANEEQTDGYECSVCKRTYHTRVPYFSEYNFCPNCGAQMRGGAL